MFPGKSQRARGFAAAAIALCLLSAALPAYLAGDVRQVGVGAGLLLCAAAAGFAAWRHERRKHLPPEEPADQPELRLLEEVAATLKDGLNTITGFSELLVHEVRACRGPEAPTASRFVLEGSEDLSRFVSNLQDFVRHEQGRIRLVEQQVDAAELVEAALSLCRVAAERADVVLVARLLEGVELRCDASRLRDAVAGMVLWSAGRAPRGSIVSISFRQFGGTLLAIRVTSMTAASARRVKDSSFTPELTLDGLTGFALPVAHRVAQLHCAELTIESGPGGQTTLCLTLPPHRIMRPRRDDDCKTRAA